MTGAARKLREATPDRFDLAATRSWSAACHFLLVRIDGDRMVVRAIGEGDVGPASDIIRRDPEGGIVTGPIEVSRQDAAVSPRA